MIGSGYSTHTTLALFFAEAWNDERAAAVSLRLMRKALRESISRICMETGERPNEDGP